MSVAINANLPEQKLELVNFESVRYAHFGLGAGHCTIAYKVDDRRNSKMRTVHFACSYTSPKDHFSRKIGRSIAYGRLMKHGKVISVEIKEGEGNALFQVLQVLKQEAYDNGPGWKDKSLVRMLPRGAVEVTRDDITYIVFEDNDDELQASLR